MVYYSLGKEVTQAEIWPAIAKENRFGSTASTTHLMVKDALSRGFAAVAFQAVDPLRSLWRCRDLGIRAILNHHLRRDTAAGHYTVLMDIDDRNVVLHDPFYGSSHTLSHTELLELWQPRFPDSEIAGYVVVGVAAQPFEALECDLCRTPLPTSVFCPDCGNPVGLQLAMLLGCISSTCISRAWNYICCPSCDHTWNFALPSPQPAAPVSTPPLLSPQAASTAPEGLDINKLFGEFDKFSAHMLALPALANHPELKKQFDFIASSKESFRSELAAVLARRAAHQARLAALVNAAKEQKEAQRKKMEELNRPSPPLDGNGLGRALLKNLGFIE